MICYKDRSFCTALDCSNLSCIRNTRRDDFKPDEFWADKVCYADMKDTCTEYEKVDNQEDRKGGIV